MRPVVMAAVGMRRSKGGRLLPAVMTVSVRGTSAMPTLYPQRSLRWSVLHTISFKTRLVRLTTTFTPEIHFSTDVFNRIILM